MYMLLVVIKTYIAVLPLIRSLTRIILQCDPHEQGRLESVGEPMLVDNLVQFVSSTCDSLKLFESIKKLSTVQDEFLTAPRRWTFLCQGM